MDGQKIVFFREQRPAVFNQCADMMAATDPWITLGMDKTRCLTAFDGPCKEVYSLWYDGQLAGFVVLQLCGTFRGYIQTLLVAEAFRGRGLAVELLNFCEAHIRQISSNMFLCVSSFNQRARAIYQTFGFREVGVLTDFLKEGFDEVLMWKRL